MTNQPRVDLLFPYPVVVVPPPDNFDGGELEELCYAERRLNGAGSARSNNGGWQSARDIFARPDLRKLTGAISERVSTGLASLPLAHSAYEINSCWINISPPGAFHWDHIHTGCAISGVFYVKADGRDAGRLWFGADQGRGEELDCYAENYKNSAFTWPRYGYDPLPGSAILFPATLTHRVDPNLSASDRISVSFNIRSQHGTTTT